jgi:hypothetical protein
MILEHVARLLELCDGDESVMPPTDHYNEGWMLRLVLDWHHRNRDAGHELSIAYPSDARWYAEALLPSAFLPRKRGDKFAESWTHADGVIGQFAIGAGAKGDLSLVPGARCFIVTEAKMFSKLSSGVTNARYYDQAARNVACMAEVLRIAKIKPEEMSTLAFYVTAPRSQIEDGVFTTPMSRDSIQATVKRRVDEYDDDKQDWYDKWFHPTFQRMDIQTIAWEDLVDEIQQVDPAFGVELAAFYAKCLTFNQAAMSSGRR